MSDSIIQIEYSPDSPVRHPKKMLSDMWNDLKASKELAWRLTVRDINSQYRQSILGLAWVFLQPLASVAAFVFMNAANILNVNSGNIPYPLFVLIGSLFWGLFSDALTCPLRMVDSGRSLLSKINFPREALLVSGLLQTIFNFFVKFLLIVPVMLWYKISVPWTVILMPVAALGLLLMGFALGLLLVPIGILYNDVSRALGVAIGFWMFLTPVAYPPLTQGIYGLLTKLNPVAPMILLARSWVFTGSFEYFGSFLVLCGGSLVLGLFGWITYRVAVPIMIERMSA